MLCDWARSALGCLGLAVLLAFAPAARAQQGTRAPARQREEAQQNNIDRWNRMSPEQRERELKRLPPERARLIRQRLRRYNQMNPEQQQALRERYKTFSQLPPEKQQVIRERLRVFRQLPPMRRQVVHGEVEHMRSMPEAQRQARLNSEEFQSQFSSEEQQIIRDLTEYLEPPK